MSLGLELKGKNVERVDYESMVIQDLENINKRDELNLSPWYQRRSVWTATQKGYLINSLFANAPIPTCYIRHYLDVDAEKSVKEVVDGQQRLRAILDYLADEFPAPVEPGGTKVYFSDLPKAERVDFKMKKLSIGTLVGATDADVIDIFGRINSVAKVLKPQEKRNAAYSGAMKQFCLRLGAKYVDFWRRTNLFTATDISRMEEVQFVSELIYNMIEGLSDFSQTRLNKLYKDYDEEFEEAEEIQTRFEDVMAQMLEVEDTIVATIFNRSPIFFSLFLLLNEWDVSIKNLKEMMVEVDSIFQSVGQDEDGADKDDKSFYDACRASTQRIKSRATRHDYLEKWFSGQ